MDKIPFMDLAGGYDKIYDEIIDKIKELINDTRFIGGEEVAKFEEEFAEYANCQHAIACANGTDALIIALKALGVGVGDKVITVPNTFIATAEAVNAVGAEPVFVDVDDKTYTMSAGSLQDYLAKQNDESKIKAIIPVHLYGQMADMEAIMELARHYNLRVIEDAAQAHGADYKGKSPGYYGDVATFSFYPGKNLGAFGDAGGLVTNNRELALEVKMLVDHGRMEKYKHQMVGYNSRLDSIQAAILRIKLRYLEEWTMMRIANAKYYDQLLADKEVITPFARDESRHVYHLYVIRIKERDIVRQYLKEKGIATGIHYPTPLHLQPAYQYLNYKQGDFPAAEMASQGILSLPLWPEMSKEKIEQICNLL